MTLLFRSSKSDSTQTKKKKKEEKIHVHSRGSVQYDSIQRAQPPSLPLFVPWLCLPPHVYVVLCLFLHKGPAAELVQTSYSPTTLFGRSGDISLSLHRMRTGVLFPESLTWPLPTHWSGSHRPTVKSITVIKTQGFADWQGEPLCGPEDDINLSLRPLPGWLKYFF